MSPIASSPWLWLGGFVGIICAIAFLQWRYNMSAIVAGRLRRLKHLLLDTIFPFARIAAELRRMNNLKELELSERINPKTGDKDPIIPVTEIPSARDTEIFWGVEPDAHGKARLTQTLQHQWESEIEDEE